jgi:hypothetical protein
MICIWIVRPAGAMREPTPNAQAESSVYRRTSGFESSCRPCFGQRSSIPPKRLHKAS